MPEVEEKLQQNSIHRFSELPDALKILSQYLSWKLVRKNGSKKASKIPYYLSGAVRRGIQGSSEDIKKLGTFEEAVRVFESGRSSGIGLAKLSGDGLIALDFDNCVANGNIDPKIADLIKDTYAELSPSYAGVRAFFQGSYPDFKNHEEKVEVFCSTGFVTLTGNRLNSNDIIPLPVETRLRLDHFRAAGGGGTGTRRAQKLAEAHKKDPVYQRLRELGMIRKEFGDGRIGIICPNESSHSADTGDGQTVYFVRNTGGYSCGHFKCLHAGCSHFTDIDFLRAIGLDPAVMDFQSSESWPDPLPLEQKPRPEKYPVEFLPAPIQSAVSEAWSAVKSPVSLVAASCLAAVSAVTQGHADIRRGKKLTGPIGTFLLTVADSGERKSTCDGLFTRAIVDYQAQQREWLAPQLNIFAADQAVWKAKKTGKLDKIRQLSKQEKPTENLENELRELEQKEPASPKIPSYLLGDSTPEHLAWSLANDWPSAAILSSEAGVILGSHGMSNDSIMRDLALKNILWDGGELAIGRRGSGAFTVRGARLTLGLQVQEPTLRKFMDRVGDLARGTGFFARCLIACPESTQGYRPYSEPPEDWPALDAFNRRMLKILTLELPITDGGCLNPPIIDLSPDAKIAWIQFHDAVEKELIAGGKYFDIRDFASKTADNAARLAAQFQIFGDGFVGSDVSLENFQSASRIAAWHLNEALRYFGIIDMSQEQKDSMALNDWLVERCRKQRLHKIPLREVRQYAPRAIRQKARFESAVKELEELDRIRIARDGKKKELWLNPKLI